MDAKEFIRELVRMCKSNGETCAGCQIRQDIGCPLVVPEKVDADRLVEIVETWSAYHPLVTNGVVAVGMMEKMDAPYIQYTKNEVGQVEMLLDASWWDEEYKGE